MLKKAASLNYVSVEQLWAFLQLPPPLHACAMLCVAPKLGMVPASLFRQRLLVMVLIMTAFLCLSAGLPVEVIGHVSFNQRVEQDE